MADKTIPQTAPIGLPAKHYYTLQEVADRWTRMTGSVVSVDDVLRYESGRDLQLSIYAPENCFTYIKKTKEKDKELTNYDRHVLSILGENVYLSILVWESTIRPFSFPMSISTILRREGVFKFSFFETDYFPDELFCTCDIKGDITSNTVSMDAIVMSMAELHRFEEAHGIGKRAQLPKPQEASEDTKAARLERALGALALGLAQSATGWRNGDAPNVSKLTSVALDAIKANEDGSRPYGYGETTIYETISASIKAVQKDQATR